MQSPIPRVANTPSSDAGRRKNTEERCTDRWSYDYLDWNEQLRDVERRSRQELIVIAFKRRFAIQFSSGWSVPLRKFLTNVMFKRTAAISSTRRVRTKTPVERELAPTCSVGSRSSLLLLFVSQKRNTPARVYAHLDDGRGPTVATTVIHDHVDLSNASTSAREYVFIGSYTTTWLYANVSRLNDPRGPDTLQLHLFLFLSFCFFLFLSFLSRFRLRSFNEIKAMVLAMVFRDTG